MALLKLSPSTKDYIWGGRRLIEEYGKHTSKDKIAETWELACHKDGACYVENPDLMISNENTNADSESKLSLQEYIAQHGKAILGSNCQHFSDFPIIIKLIDAKDNLSLQVHPDDAYALKHEHQYGKTEMWYVVDADPDSFLYYGFRQDVTKEQFRQAIADGSLLNLLNAVPVKKGDVFFINAGTIHAIGKGILIAEIQQNSNVTYRVYDYKRKDAQGNERQLHIDQSIAVANLHKSQPVKLEKHLGICEYFCVDKLSLDGTVAKNVTLYVDYSSFVSILVLSGEGIISDGKTSFAYKKGQSFFITAASGEFTISGEIEALITRIPKLEQKKVA